MVFQIFLIKYTSSGIESYEVKTFEDISINKSTPISPMPLPEEDSAENMLVKIEGNSTTMNLSWKIIPFTDDYSIGNGEIIWDGTLTKYRPTNQFAIDNTGNQTQIRSIFDQVSYLERFMPNSISDQYAIRIYDTELADANKYYNKTGLFQGITFRTDSSSPVNWTASTDFIEGSVISTLSTNTHQAPTVTAKSFYTSGNTTLGFKLSFKEYANYASGDRPETTGAVLRYKLRGTGFWLEKEITLTANTTSPYNYTDKTFTASNIDSNKDYEIKLALVTSGGRGEWAGNDPLNPLIIT